MGQIYRYKDLNQNIVYVGQVSGNDLESVHRRVKEHKIQDDWAADFKGTVEILKLPEHYLPLTQASTDALETHFINKFYKEEISHNKNWQVGKDTLQFLPDDIINAEWIPLPKGKKEKIKAGIPAYLQEPYTDIKKHTILNKIKVIVEELHKCIDSKQMLELFNKDGYKIKTVVIKDTDLNNTENTFNIYIPLNKFKEKHPDINIHFYTMPKIIEAIVYDEEYLAIRTKDNYRYFTDLIDKYDDMIIKKYNECRFLISYLEQYYPLFNRNKKYDHLLLQIKKYEEMIYEIICEGLS